MAATNTFPSSSPTSSGFGWYFHIPFGIGVYKTLNSGKTTSLCQPDDLRQFLSFISEYSSVINGIFRSHLHMDGFSLVRNNLNEEILKKFLIATFLQ